MVYEYNQFDYSQDSFEHELKECLAFYNIIKDISTLNYEDRVNYIKNKFNTIEEKTIYFGKHCKLVIKLGKDKKYDFSFEFENANLEKFREVFPELAELMKNKSVDKIKKLYPGIRSYCYQEEEIDDNNDDAIYSDYIKFYHNININEKIS